MHTCVADLLILCGCSCIRLLDKGSGELLASYTGHQHSNVKMDCALTPSDAYVLGSGEDGELVRRGC
jgi:mitogen-activated protein kinase organizer 1